MLRPACCALLMFFLLPANLSISSQQTQGSAEELLGKGLHQEEIERQYESAIRSFRAALKAPDATRLTAARAQSHIGACLALLGRTAEARQAYEALLRDYPEQAEFCAQARLKLSVLKDETARPADTPGPVIRKISPPTPPRLAGPPSPDGRYLVYSDGNPMDLIIEELATGTIRRLTKASVGYEGVMTPIAWSRDGKRLAYTWLTSKLCWELRVIGVDNRHPNTLHISNDLYFYAFDWHPDGMSIVAAILPPGAPWQLVRCSLIDRSITPFKIFPRTVSPPSTISISQDARFVAFDCTKPGNFSDSDIYVWPISGSTEIPATIYGSNDKLVGWAPDGRSLLFVSDRTGAPGLWRIPITDGKPSGEAELLKPDLGFVRSLGITKAGALYYVTSRNQVDVLLTRLDLKTGQVLSHPRPVHPYRLGTNSSPIWSRDGKFLAYLCGVSDPMPRVNPSVCVTSIADGDHRQFSVDVGPRNLYRLNTWSEDGNEILGSADRMQVRIDAKSGRVLTQYDTEAAAILPDGRTAILTSRDPRTLIITYRMQDLITGAGTQIYQGDHPAATARLAPSPDGNWLVFNNLLLDNGSVIGEDLIALSIYKGETRRLLHLPPNRRIFSLGWSRDGAEVLYTLRDAEDSPIMRLWKVPLVGGEPTKLNLTSSMLRDIAFHPDGNSLAFTSGQRDPIEIWAIENFLPPYAKGNGSK